MRSLLDRADVNLKQIQTPALTFGRSGNSYREALTSSLLGWPGTICRSRRPKSRSKTLQRLVQTTLTYNATYLATPHSRLSPPSRQFYTTNVQAMDAHRLPARTLSAG